MVIGTGTSTARAVGTVYAVDVLGGNQTHRFMTFPANAPAPNVIANTAQVCQGYGMDFDITATTLYGIANSGVELFGTIDQTTGAFTSIGPMPRQGNEVWTDLTIGPDNRFYAMLVSGLEPESVNRLYEVNPATGAPTLLSTLDLPDGTIIDLAMDANGNMFGNDFTRDMLVSIDPTTGLTTDIGPTGVDASFAQGMDFDWSTNTLYATLYTGGGTGIYASINTTTGAAIVSTTPWNAEMEMAVKAPIPEPASFASIALAGIGILARRSAGLRQRQA